MDVIRGVCSMKPLASCTFLIQLMQKIKYFLTEHVGVDKKMITYFKKQNTRAVTILKNYPMCYLCEREVGLLNAADDDD